jgi:hypothetical protein
VSTAIKSLPVVQACEVVGMISRRDIVAVLARRDDQIASELRDLVGDIGDLWELDVEDGVVTVVGPSTPQSARWSACSPAPSGVPPASGSLTTSPIHNRSKEES